MNEMQSFTSERFGQVRIVDRNGEPWFVAKDVCECLGLEQVSRACDRLDEDERVLLKVTHPQNPDKELEVCGVSESGLYALIMRSNKPEAREFRKWVTAEVLPSIRKRGVYATDDFIQKSLDDPDWAISMLLNFKQERERRKLAEAQRDEAVKTKAWIGTRREATAMNTASQKSRECERLREQLGDAQNWKAVTAIPWLRDYFALSKGLYGAIANKLKAICIEYGLERRDIPDMKYGTVKAYPVEAINILQMRVQGDPNMLGKYRAV